MRCHKITAAFLLLFAVTPTRAKSTQSPSNQAPNIILILADDLGIGDLSCYYGKYHTPNIDRIAAEGLRFTNYYSASPICSPSRAGILTGIRPAELHFTTFLNTKADNKRKEQVDFLDPNAPSVAKLLQAKGYATGHFGKWHLGGGRDVTNAPNFDQYGFDAWSGTYESPDPDPAITATNWIWSDKDSVKRWNRTAYFVDKTLAFLEANKNKPCFVNLWTDDVHTPWVAGDDETGRYPGKPEEEKSFESVLQEFDRQLGRLMTGLKELGIDDNTIVVFTSDNGPLPNFRQDRSAGLRGTKLSLYEGGIKMPFIIRWPAKIKKAGVDSTSVLSAHDLLPSFCKIAGAKPGESKSLDGEDRSTVLLGKASKRKNALIWEYGRNNAFFSFPKAPDKSPALACREDNWKLLMNADKTSIELYDLHTDKNELNNLAAKHPEIVNRLSKQLLNWWTTLPPYEEKLISHNPIDVKFGDPYILRTSSGKYYMYGTGAGAKNGFVAYSSDDLKDWKREGQVYFNDNKNGWGIHSFWAPEVYERNRKFYLFYSAQWKINPTNEEENFKIGVAVADQPTGPFIDLTDQPIFDPGYPIIDANVLFAENGKVYLYYSRCCYKHAVDSEVATWARKQGWFKEIEESWVYGVEIRPDFTGVIGEPVLLLRPPVKMNDPQAAWESLSVTSKEVNRRWTEGSFIFKHENTYYMMYSANYFGGKNYAVGYATSTSPLGPFKKAANNPVLQKNTASGGIVTGTGHNSITYTPNGKTMLCVYHGRTNKTGDERVVFIDKMEISKEGVLTVHGPTTK